jgi:hypothetical protein
MDSYLFTCIHNSPKANYKASTSEEKKQNTNHGNLYNNNDINNNSINTNQSYIIEKWEKKNI